MKKLSQVTYDDAVAILKTGYPLFFLKSRWFMENKSEAIGEPCVCLTGKNKAFVFWFFDDRIDINSADYSSLDEAHFDVKVDCYVKAHELGYFVPAFKGTDLAQSK